jgi:hypothetical protein
MSVVSHLNAMGQSCCQTPRLKPGIFEPAMGQINGKTAAARRRDDSNLFPV